MGLMDFVKKQFIDVIHWTEADDEILAYRYPMQDFEIQYGAQLTVRDSQMALFVNEGTVADVFNPGLHTLKTQTLPLLTNLKNWDKLFASPFKSDVYFYSTRLRLNRKWGTPNPITIRDKDFGAVRLRAFGIYTYKIVDPKAFYLNVSGSRETYTVEELDGQLRNSIIASITDVFAESGIPFLDMAAQQDEFAKLLRAKMDVEFQRYGLALDMFAVQNISLPEEIQKFLDQKIGIGMVGDLNKYTQFQVAQSIPIAAAQGGDGMASMGVGLGAGVGMGQAMAQALGQAFTANSPGAAQPAAAAAPPQMSAEEITSTLEKLHGLVEKGILSQAEFDAKKADLLAKL